MKLYLDDMREAPEGWMLVTSVSEAKVWLMTGRVTHASLDHDLGACASCMGGRSLEEWMDDHKNRATPHCSHVGTGYDLVCWMEKTGNWPSDSIGVHSSNPVGRTRMLQVITSHLDTLARKSATLGTT